MKLANLIKSTTAALVLSASLASAQVPAAFADDPVVQQIAAQLSAQGFEITDVKVTLLGRYKIEAAAPGYEREIVVAAGGGTVLRDEWSATDGTSGTTDGPDGAAGFPDDDSAGDTDGGSDDGMGDSDSDSGSEGGSDGPDRDGGSDGPDSDGGSDGPDSDGGPDGGSDSDSGDDAEGPETDGPETDGA